MEDLIPRKTDGSSETCELETEPIPADEEEAEAFAKAIMQRAASLKVVKIDREVFFAHRD